MLYAMTMRCPPAQTALPAISSRLLTTHGGIWNETTEDHAHATRTPHKTERVRRHRKARFTD